MKGDIRCVDYRSQSWLPESMPCIDPFFSGAHRGGNSRHVFFSKQGMQIGSFPLTVDLLKGASTRDYHGISYLLSPFVKIVAVEENDDTKCNHDLEALPSCGAAGRQKEIERKLWKEAI